MIYRTMSDAWSMANGAAWVGNWGELIPIASYEVRFSRSAQGIVLLSGVVQGGTLGQDILFLPVGYRPKLKHYLAADCIMAFCESIISTDGTINYRTETANPTWVALDGIAFIAA